MEALDYVVMAVYAAAVLGIGVWAHRKQKVSEDYFLGGRRLRWWAVGISLVATSFSSVSLIGGTGYGYSRGMGWLQLQIGDLVALVIVCAVFLPFYAKLHLTTAYEYLERRFGGAARTVGSLLFLGQTAVRAAILVYGPALALQAVVGWSVETSIVVSAAAAIAYSAFGGIAAVVWTDCIQFTVIVVAVLATLFVVASDIPGGAGAAMDYASDHNRLEAVTLSTDPKTPMNLLGSLVPYMVLALSLYGTGQQAVQRYLCCKDLRSARRAALTGWAAGTAALSIALLLGVFLFAWHELAPAAEGFALDKGDKVLPKFLATRMPAGLAGLMLAAIFAASMSSLDSAVHSMSTCFLVDFVRRYTKRPPDERRELRLARVTTVVIGIIATLGALAAARAETTLLETMVNWLGYFAGPLLGLFLLGMLTTKVEERAALWGVAMGAAYAVVLAWFKPVLPFHTLWVAPISCVVTVGTALLMTLLLTLRLRRRA
ncbi:MAG: sodium:solute symporter family transporter [Planctomycetota bacterium]